MVFRTLLSTLRCSHDFGYSEIEQTRASAPNGNTWKVHCCSRNSSSLWSKKAPGPSTRIANKLAMLKCAKQIQADSAENRDVWCPREHGEETAIMPQLGWPEANWTACRDKGTRWHKQVQARLYSTKTPARLWGLTRQQTPVQSPVSATKHHHPESQFSTSQDWVAQTVNVSE